MKSKKILSTAVAAALALGTMGVAFSGCLSTNNEEDVKQVVATVNIAQSSDNFAAVFGEDYKNVLEDDKILKRDLLIGFLNVGSQYVNSGVSYADTFDAIVNSLVQNSIMTQYATVALFKDKVEKEGSSVFTEYAACENEIQKLEYLLDDASVKEAKYSVEAMLNGGIDSYEKRIINEEAGAYEGTGTRSTPNGIDTLKEDYIPAEYGIYTGYGNYTLSNAGSYEKLDGSDITTRRKAYSEFIKFLDGNYFLSSEDEDRTDVWNLSYVKETYASQLQQTIVEKYNEKFEAEQQSIIDTVDSDTGVYTYISSQYRNTVDGEYDKQANNYSTASAFETAMGNLSDTSFILYSPATTEDTQRIDSIGTTTPDNKYGTFGYVYNILLPFSSIQEVELKALQSRRDNDIINDGEYFAARNELLKNIYTTDQRSAWFNGENDYSFDVAAYNNDKGEADKLAYYNAGDADRNYLFFENNLLKSGDDGEYETLDKYVGLYSYNGKVVANEDGSYRLSPNKLTIDDMLSEFSAYINYVLTGNADGDKVTIKGTTGANFGEATFSEDYYGYTGQDFYKTDSASEIDYSKLVYARGRVALDDNDKGTQFLKDSQQYKVMSAVNELQYAYTTDTGVLSQYIGYSVSAYDTNYIKEFEYAAQMALREGVGTFYVCAGDYGWHLLYVTDVFKCEGGEVYSPNFVKANIETEGTFENRFYNWVKESAMANETSLQRSEILHAFDAETTATIYKETYKDLANLR